MRFSGLVPARRPRPGPALSRPWPGLCAVCRGWGRGRVCDDCRLRFAPPVARCGRCALRVADGVAVCGACLVAPPPFDAAHAAVDYGYPWDALVAAFKFRAALDLAPTFAAMVAGDTDDATPADAARPWLLPVPLDPGRLRERGFNQAWEIARRVARRWGAEADAGVLVRLRDTPHQLALPPEARRGNVAGAFAVEPRRLREVRGRHVAIVDDVMTTGHTLAEIARTLKRAGAARVEVRVVARTPAPGDA